MVGRRRGQAGGVGAGTRGPGEHNTAGPITVVCPHPGVRRGGCEEWGCGATNGTKLTGIAQERVEATEPVVSAVTLPSGETIDLR